MNKNKKYIHNSTTEFLIFSIENQEQGVEVVYNNETIWATQRAIAELFGVGIPAINKHLNNIYAEGELQRDSTISKMEIVQAKGDREVKRRIDFYNLDAIISVGYRINSC